MQNFFIFLFAILLGFGCRKLAIKQGKNPTVWFLLGAFFGVIPLLILALFPPKPKVVVARIPKEPTLTTLLEAHADKLWYYLGTDRSTIGPMSLKNLAREWKEGKVNASSLVWNEELTEWKRFTDVLKEEISTNT